MSKKPIAFVYGRNAVYGISYSRIAYDVGVTLYENGYDVYNLGLGSLEMPAIHRYIPFEIVPIPEPYRVRRNDNDELLQYLTKEYRLPVPDIVIIIEDIGSATVATRLKRIWPNAKYIMYTMFDANHLGIVMPFDIGMMPIKKAFDDIDHVIVPTTFSYDVFKKYGIEPSIIPLYYDEMIFGKSKMIQKPDRYTVLSIARNTDRKNLGNILYALSSYDLSEIMVRFRTEIQLHDATSIDINGLIFTLNIVDNVMFEKFDVSDGNSNAELVYSYNNAHLGIYPSTREGFCMPALESMACGLPVIVTRHTAMDSWVPTFLPRFEPATIRFAGGLTSIEQIVSPEEIANKILEAKDTYFNEKEIIEYAENFTLSKFKNRLLDLLKNL